MNMEAQLRAELGDDLCEACIGNQRQSVEKLVEKRIETGSDPSSILRSLMTAAAASDAADVLAFCLQRGIPVTDSVMLPVAATGAFACHRVLIQAKAIDIDYYIPWYGDILGIAATDNLLDWARFCLENGANPNYNPVDNYKTVLAATCESGHQAMVGLLLQHGAWLRGSGAIVLAAKAGQTDIVRLLLAKGADVNELGVENPTVRESNQDIGTALHKAISQGHVETARLLIGAGASLELKDNRGRTPKMLAEQCHQTEIENEIKHRKAKGL